MEGIINMESLFDSNEEENEEVVLPYEFPRSKVTLHLKTRKLHIGVSRVILFGLIDTYSQCGQLV